ncbi:MAG: NAD-dependent epimerase/dehydratase family protein [Gammaproteobacteria bacterium]
MRHLLQLARQRTFVTGASGFIGSHLCRRLLEVGAEVHGGNRYERPGLDARIQWWHEDLTDIGRARTILQAIRPDIIFHLAGEASGSPDLNVVEPTLQKNLVTAVNLLALATEMGCGRIILAGSSDEPDSAECIPSPYAASKMASSLYARMFSTLYRTPVVVARICFIYGPGQDRRKLIPYVILSLLQGQHPRLSSGRLEVDWIYMDDVIDGLLLMACAPKLEGRTVDIGSGTLVSTRALVEQLVNMIDPTLSAHFGAIPDRPFESEIVRSANTESTYDLMKWRPSVSLADGLRRTVDWHKQDLSCTTIYQGVE